MDFFNCSNFVFIFHIPPQIACVLGGAHLLAMTKPSNGVCPIVVWEMYQLISYALCFQFFETFATHFSPCQFGVVTKCGCEIIIHSIRCTLDLHPNWVAFQLDVANTFNSMLRGFIFQEFRVANGDIIQLIPLFRAFYAFEFYFVLQSS